MNNEQLIQEINRLRKEKNAVIMAHYYTLPEIQDIADFVGYSASHFSMMFKKTTGHSPLSYINMMKIRHDCTLLEQTEMKINQICHKIGISDCYYFSRLFRKTMGLSPKDYRESRK